MQYTKDAPIKRAVYKFKLAWFKLSTKKQMPHEWRYTIGEQIRNDILDMSKCVNVGYTMRDKSAKINYYNMAQGILVNIQDDFNMLNDLNVIDNETKAKMDIAIVDIQRQLSGLISSLTNEVKRDGAARQ